MLKDPGSRRDCLRMAPATGAAQSVSDTPNRTIKDGPRSQREYGDSSQGIDRFYRRKTSLNPLVGNRWSPLKRYSQNLDL